MRSRIPPWRVGSSWLPLCGGLDTGFVCRGARAPRLHPCQHHQHMLHGRATNSFAWQVGRTLPGMVALAPQLPLVVVVVAVTIMQVVVGAGARGFVGRWCGQASSVVHAPPGQQQVTTHHQRRHCR